MASDSAVATLTFQQPGLHLLAFQSNNSSIALEADKFNAYLTEDGIENILALRKQRGELGKPARELYQRCAKTMLQVSGVAQTGLIRFGTNTGMPLEIIPQQNPYALKAGDELAVEILFEGKPLPNAVVRTWQRAGQSAMAQARYRTDARGQVRVKITAAGQWMISLVRMVPLTTPTADYQSYWASYTFGLM